jgi:hypothetical protein
MNHTHSIMHILLFEVCTILYANYLQKHSINTYAMFYTHNILLYIHSIYIQLVQTICWSKTQTWWPPSHRVLLPPDSKCAFYLCSITPLLFICSDQESVDTTFSWRLRNCDGILTIFIGCSSYMIRWPWWLEDERGRVQACINGRILIESFSVNAMYLLFLPYHSFDHFLGESHCSFSLKHYRFHYISQFKDAPRATTLCW